MAMMTWRRYHGGGRDWLRRDPGCGDGDAGCQSIDLDFASIGQVTESAPERLEGGGRRALAEEVGQDHLLGLQVSGQPKGRKLPLQVSDIPVEFALFAVASRPTIGKQVMIGAPGVPDLYRIVAEDDLKMVSLYLKLVEQAAEAHACINGELAEDD